VIAAFIALAASAAAPAAADCTEKNSSPARIEAVTAQPQQWLDRCVKLSGIAGGLVLHSSLDTMYRSARYGDDGNRILANLKHRIGIDSQELRGHPVLRTEARRIEVIGRVDSCERRRERIVAAGGIPFLGGYCHYEGGPTVVVASYRIVSGQHERLVGEAERRRVGDLVEPPGDWEWRDALEGLARNFAAALRAADRTRLASLLSYGESLEEERIVSILREPAYRELREGIPGEIRLFTQAKGGRFRSSESGYVFAHLCYCRTRDCSGRWPIASRDADAGLHRPYVCVSVSGRAAPPAKLDLYADAEGGWLAEPARFD
jgi:hypothetical protein